MSNAGKLLARPSIEALAFVVRSNSQNLERIAPPKNSHMKCGMCGKLGHTLGACKECYNCG